MKQDLLKQDLLKIRTLGELRAAGVEVLPVRLEMRRNLLNRLRARERILPGIIGYDQSVLPEIENGVLAGHHMIFLGERGQAKSRLIRLLADLLDERVAAVRAARSMTIPFGQSAVRAGGARMFGELEIEGWTRAALRRKAGDARRFGGRLIGGSSDQGRRGPLPRRRGDHPLRPHPAHQPRHLRDQRIARPDREGPGGTVQPDGREGRPDKGLSGAPAA
jgi:hypothetical protein